MIQTDLGSLIRIRITLNKHTHKNALLVSNYRLQGQLCFLPVQIKLACVFVSMYCVFSYLVIALLPGVLHTIRSISPQPWKCANHIILIGSLKKQHWSRVTSFEVICFWQNTGIYFAVELVSLNMLGRSNVLRTDKFPAQFSAVVDIRISFKL